MNIIVLLQRRSWYPLRRSGTQLVRTFLDFFLILWNNKHQTSLTFYLDLKPESLWIKQICKILVTWTSIFLAHPCICTPVFICIAYASASVWIWLDQKSVLQIWYIDVLILYWICQLVSGNKVKATPTGTNLSTLIHYFSLLFLYNPFVFDTFHAFYFWVVLSWNNVKWMPLTISLHLFGYLESVRFRGKIFTIHTTWYVVMHIASSLLKTCNLNHIQGRQSYLTLVTKYIRY